MSADRILPSWIGGFLEYTQNLWSTDLFRLWTAISAIGGALERKVWIRSQSAEIYPNLYIFLVGPPGAGKTRPVQVCHEIWANLVDHHTAPVSLTKASLMDEVAAATRTIPFREGDLTFNGISIASRELGALIPTYDADFLNAMTYLYDNIKYDEKRRGKPEPLIIENPVVNLIGCTTPSYLLDTMPITAWDQGFLSRVIIVYDDIVLERPLDLSEESKQDNDLRKALIHDIKIIGNRVGKLIFLPEAKARIDTWYADRESMPSHPRLQNYVTRRPIHLMKLAMIACADRGMSDSINLDDINAAIDWLMRAEDHMGDLFTAMASGGDAHVIQEVWYYVTTVKARTKKLVPAHMIWKFLQDKVPSYNIGRLLDTMTRSKMLISEVKEGIVLFDAKPKGDDKAEELL